MWDPDSNETSGASWPAALLDSYMRAFRATPGSLSAIALSTRSTCARRLLAHAATNGSASLEHLLRAAHRGYRAVPRLGTRLDPDGLANLARVIALQNVLSRDRTDGLALYEMCLEMFGAEALSPWHQATHLQLTYALGDYPRAEFLLDTYPRVPADVRSAVKLDLTNPFNPVISENAAPVDEWLESFQELLPDCPLALKPGKGICLDRLHSAVARNVEAALKVTVIVTCFMPGEGLLTAVRSVLDQSWRNHEVLVVDDGSPAEYNLVLSQCEALDERVTVIRTDINTGTYNARNTALDVASGQFVTFQDSDDWSHPVRIERQVQSLLEDPERVATVGKALKVTGHLALTRPGRHYIGEATPTLMFRRRQVLERIGYFDNVRKGADNEYMRRVQAAFGGGTIHRLQEKPVLLMRQTPGSLSRDEFGPGWMHPARGAYWSAYGEWHQTIRRGSASPYLARRQRRRPFFAPTHVLEVPNDRSGETTYDVILVDDWRRPTGANPEALEEIAALTRRGLSVAVTQMCSFRHFAAGWEPSNPEVQKLINSGRIDEATITDSVRAAVLIVRDPSVLQYAARTPPCRVSAGEVVIVASTPPSEHGDDAYNLESCSLAAEELFGTIPTWCPRFPAVRQRLESNQWAPRVTAFDLPSVIDADTWDLDRTRFRSRGPVIGLQLDEGSATSPADRTSLVELYSDAPEVDVRIKGDAEVTRRVLARDLPTNWLVYEDEEIDLRCFLSQLDCYFCFPIDPPNVTSRLTIIKAMASGCTVILPPQLRDEFGEAAVYSRPTEAHELAQIYCSRWEMFQPQSNRARKLVRERFSHSAHYERVAALMSSRSEAEVG